MRNPIAGRVHPTGQVFRYFALTLALLPALAFAAGLDEAFVAMDKTAQKFISVSTDISRDTYTALIDDHDKDAGVIRAKRGKSHDTAMLIELTGRNAKSVEIAGGQATVYTPKTKTAQTVSVKPGLVDQFLLLGFGSTSAEVKEHYEVTLAGVEKTGPDMTWHLQLIPKSPEELKYVKKAEIWISQASGLPVQEKLYTSTTGDYFIVNYSNVKLNPNLPDKDVKLKLPNGVTREHPQL